MALGEGEVAKALLSFQKAEYDEELSVKDTLTQFFGSQVRGDVGVKVVGDVI